MQLTIRKSEIHNVNVNYLQMFIYTIASQKKFSVSIAIILINVSPIFYI